MSSGDGFLFYAGGCKIWGGCIKGSLRWAYPSTSTEDIFLYFAAFLKIDDIYFIYINIYKYVFNFMIDEWQYKYIDIVLFVKVKDIEC